MWWEEDKGTDTYKHTQFPFTKFYHKALLNQRLKQKTFEKSDIQWDLTKDHMVTK